MAEQPIPAQTTAGNSGPDKGPGHAAAPDLAKQLAERDEEILRLRDLLIARDAELGAARGRLALLEQHSRRLTKLSARIPIPILGRILASIALKLRG